ncbi:Conserved_hypothetical protein [Hexamita inflata]|uniref:Uncharacterized protein n=1 Tax=Hexamita inflata TaxID=28002 RepID=A0AA86PF56_9EUKA|nr:Conserved hypothetical protein [Hexamita inflata]
MMQFEIFNISVPAEKLGKRHWHSGIAEQYLLQHHITPVLGLWWLRSAVVTAIRSEQSGSSTWFFHQRMKWSVLCKQCKICLGSLSCDIQFGLFQLHASILSSSSLYLNVVCWIVFKYVDIFFFCVRRYNNNLALLSSTSNMKIYTVIAAFVLSCVAIIRKHHENVKLLVQKLKTVYFKQLFNQTKYNEIKQLNSKLFAEIEKNDQLFSAQCANEAEKVVVKRETKPRALVQYDNKTINGLLKIQQFDNFTYLNMSDMMLDDLSFILNHSKLTHVDVSNNSISRLEALSDLTDLVQLDLRNNKIIFVNDLKNICQKTKIFLTQNYILDLFPIKGLIEQPDFCYEYIGQQYRPTLQDFRNYFGVDSNQKQLLKVMEQQYSKQAGSVLLLQKSYDEHMFRKYFEYITENASSDIYRNGVLRIQNDAEILDVSFLDRFNGIIEHLFLKNVANLNFSRVPSLVRKLSFNQSKLNQIHGLGRMDLMYLDLSNNSLSDLSELAHLTALNHLDLSQNLVSDISSLGQLKNLAVLNLNQNQILFLKPLRELKKLKSLQFNDNYVQNFEPVFDLKLFSNSHLLKQSEPDYLSLGFHSSELSQIQKLNAESDRLVHDLRMSQYENQIENGILDIKNELKLFNIKFADKFRINEVSLHSCTGFGFELVSNTITILKANYCNITSLQNIEQMAQLVSIDLSHNHLVDISQLAKLPNLSSVDVSHNQLVHVSQLKHWKPFSSVNFRFNHIIDSDQPDQQIPSALLKTISLRLRAIQKSGETNDKHRTLLQHALCKYQGLVDRFCKCAQLQTKLILNYQIFANLGCENLQ